MIYMRDQYSAWQIKNLYFRYDIAASRLVIVYVYIKYMPAIIYKLPNSAYIIF